MDCWFQRAAELAITSKVRSSKRCENFAYTSSYLADDPANLRSQFETTVLLWSFKRMYQSSSDGRLRLSQSSAGPWWFRPPISAAKVCQTKMLWTTVLSPSPAAKILSPKQDWPWLDHETQAADLNSHPGNWLTSTIHIFWFWRGGSKVHAIRIQLWF